MKYILAKMKEICDNRRGNIHTLGFTALIATSVVGGTVLVELSEKMVEMYTHVLNTLNSYPLH